MMRRETKQIVSSGCTHVGTFSNGTTGCNAAGSKHIRPFLKFASYLILKPLSFPCSSLLDCATYTLNLFLLGKVVRQYIIFRSYFTLLILGKFICYTSQTFG